MNDKQCTPYSLKWLDGVTVEFDPDNNFCFKKGSLWIELADVQRLLLARSERATIVLDAPLAVTTHAAPQAKLREPSSEDRGASTGPAVAVSSDKEQKVSIIDEAAEALEGLGLSHVKMGGRTGVEIAADLRRYRASRRKHIAECCHVNGVECELGLNKNKCPHSVLVSSATVPSELQELYRKAAESVGKGNEICQLHMTLEQHDFWTEIYDYFRRYVGRKE